MGWLYGCKFWLLIDSSTNIFLILKKVKKRKLEEQFDKDSTTNAKQHERKSNLFHGISIFVDGYTGKNNEKLRLLIVEMDFF